MTENIEEKEVPRLSYSIAYTLVTRTPAHAYDQHRLLGGNGKKSTKAMDEGKLMEKFVLGADLDKIVLVEADSWRGKEAQTAKASAELLGKEPVLQKDYDEAKEAAVVIVENFKKKGVDLALVTDAEKGIEVFVQIKLTWTSAEGVLCSGVIDRLVLDHKRGKAFIYDFKTTSNASTKEFSRSVYQHGYHIQQNGYEEAVGLTWPEFLGRIETLFLVAETDSPFCVRVLPLAGSMAELGRRAWSEAKRIWAECTASGIWPGYPDERIEATAWMLAEQMEADALRGGDFEVVGELGGMKG